MPSPDMLCRELSQAGAASLHIKNSIQVDFGQELTALPAIQSSWVCSVRWRQSICSAGLFPTALLYGGPVPILYGWLLISALQLVIGLALAELSSSYPLAGGPYFW